MPTKNNDPIAVAIRRAAIADAMQMCAIEQAASTVPWSLSAFESELSNEHGASYVALDDSQGICAYIISVIVTDELHIHNLATQEQFRRRRMAARLIDKVIEAAVRQGVQKAYLEVRSKNSAAIGLYEKCGFSTQLIRKKYYSDDGDDALIMTKNIGTIIRTS
jgi:ribosomal-protein-alanine acetyltransferase